MLHQTRVLLTGTAMAQGQIQGHGNLQQNDTTYVTPDESYSQGQRWHKGEFKAIGT